MQIKKSELRGVIKEQVAAFFVTPQPFGMVSRSNNLESSLIKFGTNDVDKKELTKVINQTMSELEEEATKRMKSSKLKEAKKKSAKWHEAIKRPVKVGDTVHVGHAQKGGAGVEGKVTKITGNVVYIKNDAGKTYKGPLKNTAIMEISGVDSLKPNDPHTPEDEAEKDAADDVMEAFPHLKIYGAKKKAGKPTTAFHIKNLTFNTVPDVLDYLFAKRILKKDSPATRKSIRGSLIGLKTTSKLYVNGTRISRSKLSEAAGLREAITKKGGRPRGGPHIENVRFWDLEEKSLRFIIKDASQAVAANPTARKAGKWADEVNDAVTVLHWRKKKGIKEVNTGPVVTEGFKEGTKIPKVLAAKSTIKMSNPKDPRWIFAIVSRFGSKGVTSAASQDKVSMVVVDKAGKVIKDWGSHVNVKGALKFAQSKGYTKKIDESWNASPKLGGDDASVISTADNETNEIGSLASSPKAKAIIKKMHDLVTKQLKFKTVEDIQPIQGGVAFIFGDKAEASKMTNYLKKKNALGKVIPLAGGTGKRTMVSLRAK